MEKNTAKKQNRVLYIVSVTVLVLLTVLVAVTSVARQKPDNLPADSTDTRKESLEGEEPPATDAVGTAADTEKTPPETEPSGLEEDPSEEAAAKLPVFAVMPLPGNISKNYSQDVPVFSLTMNDFRTHGGIDIAGELSDPVYAVADGTVGNVWEDPFMGTCISIVHSGGAVSIYRNLAEEVAASVGSGASVKAGQVIAYVGETALLECAEEPHLHYELTVNGTVVDPMEYLPASTSTGVFED